MKAMSPRRVISGSTPVYIGHGGFERLEKIKTDPTLRAMAVKSAIDELCQRCEEHLWMGGMEKVLEAIAAVKEKEAVRASLSLVQGPH